MLRGVTSNVCDLIVIGGGSGGLAAAKEAKRCGAKRVVVFDYVKPTPVHGTKWGLGGTCVNVGCIPKKLMHYASLMGPIVNNDALKFGWEGNRGANEGGGGGEGEGNLDRSIKHDWLGLIENVQGYVKKLNFSYRTGLRASGVEYINALAELTGPNEVSYTMKGDEKPTLLSSPHIVISVGGRPHIPEEVEGARNLAITSDDLFSYRKRPGKTLVVGASYIALECAGFLTHLDVDVSVAVRSVLLRGFDRQCAEKVGSVMTEYGTKFLLEHTPQSMARSEDGRIKVTFTNGYSDVFDTVLYATGRRADTEGLHLERAGVELDPNGKIKATNEQSNVPSIYVVGDALSGGPELTPVAIRTGELLARRLFGGSKVMMDYINVPTTVFTPMEYGSCGLSEEAAIAKYGEENVEVYVFEFPSLEISASHREKATAARADEFDVDVGPNALSKLVCLKNENEKVVGFHFVGPNAGEITQGFALAVRLGATKSDFDSCVGIHPTDAESFCSLTVTKSSGESWVAVGGCGGGKCG